MHQQSARWAFILATMTLFVVASHAIAAQRKPVKVWAVAVKESRFHDRTEALGTLRANESVTITANVTETVTAIHFDDGERVRVGQVLVEMTSAEEQALLKEAQSNATEAQRQWLRIQQLVEAGTASQALLDQRQRDATAAKARLVATQSRLKDRIIKAPFAGVVGLRRISLGALVRPGDLITTLSDNSQMKLDFTVPSVFLASLATELPIIARSRVYPQQRFQGRISSIDNQIDPVTRAITVRALLPNSQGLLKPGLLMQVDVLTNARMALTVPERSLLPEGRNHYVMVARQGEGGELVAEKRQVTVASRRPGDVEITSGLVAGEQVITDGAFKIKTGTPVDIVPILEARPLPSSTSASLSS